MKGAEFKTNVASLACLRIGLGPARRDFSREFDLKVARIYDMLFVQESVFIFNDYLSMYTFTVSRYRIERLHYIDTKESYICPFYSCAFFEFNSLFSIFPSD